MRRQIDLAAHLSCCPGLRWKLGWENLPKYFPSAVSIAITVDHPQPPPKNLTVAGKNYRIERVIIFFNNLRVEELEIRNPSGGTGEHEIDSKNSATDDATCRVTRPRQRDTDKFSRTVSDARVEKHCFRSFSIRSDVTWKYIQLQYAFD